MMIWLTVVEYLCHKRSRICSICRKPFPVNFSFMTYHRVGIQINTTGATSGAGTAYSSGAPKFTPGFRWSSCYSIFSFMCMFCRSLFVRLYFFFQPFSLLSVLLRFTDSDYPFGIFMLFLHLLIFMYIDNNHMKYLYIPNIVSNISYRFLCKIKLQYLPIFLRVFLYKYN